MSTYFAHISAAGPIRHGQVPGSIGVLEALDQFMPIGEAHCVTWDENGLAVWTLRGNPVSVHHSCPKRRTDTGFHARSTVEMLEVMLVVGKQV